MALIIRVGKVLTANPRDEILHDVAIRIEGNRIVSILPSREIFPAEAEMIIDAPGCTAIPGFVQTHVHLCQTLFRGLADDLHLLDWLRDKIFPLEAAHSEESMYSAAFLGIAELIRSGTTTILDMGSIHFEERIIRAIGETGLRAYVGKAMMDLNDAFPKLKESTQDAIKSTRDLAERWHNSYDDRVRYAVAPRFVLTCTDKLLKEACELTQSFGGALFHTHASESKLEIEAVRCRCKMENVEFLNTLGLLSQRSCLAHCIHLNENEVQILKSTRTNVAHCPSSNLKLGSGIAKIPYLLSQGINVTLGADGAPCNNSLDMFQEMRLASLIQKPGHGPASMPAKSVFQMATMGGAKALGLDRDIGSIEVGKKADLVLLNLDRIWNPVMSDGDIYSSIVHSAGPENVDSVMIDGRWVYRKKQFVEIDEDRILSDAQMELKSLLNRL